MTELPLPLLVRRRTRRGAVLAIAGAALVAALVLAGCASPPCLPREAQAQVEWPGLLAPAVLSASLEQAGWGNVSSLQDGSGVLAHRQINDTVTLRASLLHKAGGPTGTTVLYLFADGSRVGSSDEARGMLAPYSDPLVMALQAKLGDPTFAAYRGGSC